jgi:hypothetical protein
MHPFGEGSSSFYERLQTAEGLDLPDNRGESARLSGSVGGSEAGVAQSSG